MVDRPRLSLCSQFSKYLNILLDAILVLLEISLVRFCLVSADYFYLFFIGTHFAISL